MTPHQSDTLVGRLVLEKTKKFMMEFQSNDIEKMLQLQILGRDTELRAHEKDLFIGKLKDWVCLAETQPLRPTNWSTVTQQSHSQHVFQQFQTASISANNAKFPYLEKDKYEIWAMKMEYWIQNADHNLWRIVQQGNSPKRLGKDAKGNTIVHPPVSLDEHVAVQRENKVRTLLLQALPEDHMPDFHHYDDARDIWMAVKARFGGNEESKKMRKTMLKQQFQNSL
ncbi:hypothetical protein Tco_0059070 [Tanacetum coccineum]